ncbi:MAG: hypothetical protein U1F11_01510 [Steroidobacteraceae bacterium]
MLSLAVRAALLSAALTGCAGGAAARPDPDAEGEPVSFRAADLGSALATNPRDAQAHLALARQYDRAASARGDLALRRLALVGYESALRFDPQNYAASMLAGRAAAQEGRYARAEDYFVAALMIRPDDATALLALATAAYNAGDPELASLCASRAAQLAPTRGEPLRLAALAAAARGRHGDSGQAQQLYARLATPAELASLQARSATLLRTAPTEQELPEGGRASPAGPAARSADQVSVDVAIVLSQNTRRRHIGLNLLDGLRAQYSVSDQDQETRAGGSRNAQRTITSAISTPQLNYNLNIFNATGQFYQVVARPVLTAFRGETSNFFVGRTANVPVSGVNVATVEKIDIGISLKVTPIEILPDRVKVRVEAGRSFASNDTAGSFAEQLTVFRQDVAATAEVRLGETLVLSGLSESVNDSANTKVPGLGDLPLVGVAFNERSQLERRDAALVLLTPSLPNALPSEPWARPSTVQKLADLWATVIDPASNAADVAARLRHSRLFTRMATGDAPLEWRDGGGLHSFEALLLSRSP